MSAYLVDEEKGEAGFHVNDQVNVRNDTTVSTQSSPTVVGSPLFSRANTFLHDTTTTDTTTAKKSGHLERTDNIWSTGITLLKSAVSFGKKSTTKRQQTTNNNNEENCSSGEEDEDIDDDADGSIVRKIHEQARGYPRLATFLDSDENFMVYRRFGYLQTRLLLDKQNELQQLEFDLDMMEDRESKDPKLSRGLLTRRNTTPEKRALLETIETKWNAYCQLLSHASTLAALNKPTLAEHRSVNTWLNNTKPVVPTEARFIRCKEDLVILRPGREHAWLDSGIEKTLKWIGWAPLRRMFQSRDTRVKSDGRDGTLLFSRGRINNFVIGIITLMILALLVVPIYVLFYVSDHTRNASQASVQSIGVLLVATLAFSACISLFTRARRHEILAASAAYCAVLVVFIGNLGQKINLP